MSSPKMRGLFDKNSVPPPPAGRGPLDVPKAAGVAPPPAASLPEPRGLPTDSEVTVSAAFPFLPEPEQSPQAPAPAATQDDPIADLFDADPPRPSLAGNTSGDSEEAITAPVANIEPAAEPEAVVLEADGASIPPDAAATGAVKAATEESFASLFTSEPPKEPTHVAKVELTRATPGSAHEIAAADFSRDPRSEESVRPQQDAPSTPSAEVTPGPDAPTASGLFPEARADLQGVVFDPDQSVARHLGEVAIDSEMGAAAPSEELRDLPLPQVPAPLSVDDGPMEKPPVRSMRPALIVMALLMVSGGALTLGSLGVLEESPDTYRREAAEARKARETTATTGSAPTAAAAPAKVMDTTEAPPPEAPSVKEAPPVETPAAEEAPAIPEPVAAAVAAAAETEEDEARSAPSTEATEPSAIAHNAGGDPIAAGDSLLRAGDLSAALVQYEAALREDSKDHHAMEGLVRIHLARGNAELALPFAEQIVKRRPKRAAYRVLHGQALLGVGDRAGARRAFQEALTLEPGNSDARRLLGS